MSGTEKSPFSRDDQAKEAGLLKLRARFAAATPATLPRKRPREPVDWRRTLQAGALVLILLVAMVLGSGVFS